ANSPNPPKGHCPFGIPQYKNKENALFSLRLDAWGTMPPKICSGEDAFFTNCNIRAADTSFIIRPASPLSLASRHLTNKPFCGILYPVSLCGGEAAGICKMKGICTYGMDRLE
ncbi:MAG: hypothetical protein IKX57_07345, partial [Oscillospiraceae bacterium]|nr:hypothetical protein [Oscillospiraceae bacterium]